MLATRDNFSDCLKCITSGPIFLDVETTGLNPYPNKISNGDVTVGVAIRCQGKSFYFPVRHAGGENITSEQYRELIERISGMEIRNHNTKFDLHFMARDGLPLPPKIACTNAGAHLWDENHSMKLKVLADKYLGSDSSKEQAALHRTLLQNGLNVNEMWQLSPSLVGPYAEKDVELAEGLDAFYRGNMYDPNAYDEASEFTRVITQMEMVGVKVDREVLARLTNEAEKEVHRLQMELNKLAGFPFNGASPKQVCAFLRLPDSTGETLEKCSHPMAAIIVAQRGWAKMLNTYYKVFDRELDPQGRLHAHYNPCGTVTGRLSCSNPNLTAVPRTPSKDTPWSKVKNAIVAPEGKVLVELDYSMAEIRVATHFTKEPTMVAALLAKQDIHQAVADELGISRQDAKTVNFSIIYGIGARTLSEKLNKTEAEAKVILDKYHGSYPGYRKLTRAAQNLAERHGFITLYGNRRRHFNSRDAESRTAFSGLVQGSVASVVRKAMVAINGAFHHNDARMVMQVHDSIVLEVQQGMEHKIIPEIKHIMEYQPWCSVPMVTDAKVGPTWGALEKYEPKS